MTEPVMKEHRRAWLCLPQDSFHAFSDCFRHILILQGVSYCHSVIAPDIPSDHLMPCLLHGPGNIRIRHPERRTEIPVRQCLMTNCPESIADGRVTCLQFRDDTWDSRKWEKRRMMKGMVPYNMSFIHHSAYKFRVFFRLAADDEETCPDIVPFQDIQNLRCGHRVRSVVKSESHLTCRARTFGQLDPYA